MEEATRVRVSGPLAVLVPDVIEYLAGLGYRDHSVAVQLQRLAKLSCWVEEDGVEPASIDEELISRWVGAAHRGGRARSLTPSSFRVLLGYLRSRRVVPSPALPSTPMDAVMGDYREYLSVERGLAASTMVTYMASAAWFLSAACGGDPRRIASLSVEDVARFVLKVARRRSPRSVNEVVVGTRSLLRYFYVKSLIATPLAQATPWLARGRTSSLPRTLPPGQGRLLIDSCDQTTLVGVRDFALITVLVRLGLRVGEVAAMELADIDWRRGELLVRSKGGWRDALPLPVDVGEAIVAYLTRRDPDPEFPEVFLHVKAPRGPTTMTDVRAVVRRACARVGIPDTSTHRLRHGAAMEMLRGGAPLHEIGQVLRHRDLETTAVYAKVDFAALASVADEWPGNES